MPTTPRRALLRLTALFAAAGLLAVCPCPVARETVSFFKAEPQTGAYVVTVSTPDRRTIDPSVFSFALVSYDERRVYERIPFRVDRVESPAVGPGATVADGYTFHVRLRFPDAAPGFYTLYLRAPYPTAEFQKTALPIDVPDRSAANLRALRRRYVGRLAWTYGNLGLSVGQLPSGVRSAEISAQGRLRVTRIERASGITVKIDDYSTNDGLIYEAVDPLIVHVRVEQDMITGTGWRGGTRAKEAATEAAIDRSPDLTFMVSDRWDLERTIALHPPDIDLAKHKNLIGLTHEEVAFIHGFPWIYGSRAELMRMPRWDYPYVAPNAFTVDFRGDRVVHDDPRREML